MRNIKPLCVILRLTILMLVVHAYNVTAANLSQEASRGRQLAKRGDIDTRALDLSHHLVSSSHVPTGLPEIESASVERPDELKTSASYHHKKTTKGWLDMGAWSKDKGAFGWYADYPVGKGK